MSRNPSGASPRAVQRFWHSYFTILEKSSMPVRTRPWYRKHVEEYIRAHPGYRLADHLPHDIDEYLAAKGRLGSLQEWRFRQIVDALRLLFTELITTRWADAYDWAQWRAFARSLEPDVREYKYYCPGIGVVLEENLKDGTRVELTEMTTN